MSVVLSELSEPARWYAITTRGGVEKQVFDRLRDDGQRMFWPRYLWDGRTVPLFPTYLFHQAPAPADTAVCLSIPGVMRVLGDDKPTPIRRGELERLIALAEVDQIIDIDKMLGRTPRAAGEMFQHGDEVRISGGIFQGFAATVLRGKTRGGRIRVEMFGTSGSFGREIDIEIAEDLIELRNEDGPSGPRRKSIKAPFDRYDKAVRGRARA